VTKKAVLICSMLAISISLACSQGAPAPQSPSTLGSAELGPDGATLKVGAPNLSGPSNGTQVSLTPTLSWSAVNGKFKTFAVTYQVEVRNSATGVVETFGPMSNTSATLGTRPFNTQYTWRVRVFLNNEHFGPWSATNSFRTEPEPPPPPPPPPPAAYITANEIRDPIHTGTTVGQVFGPHTFIPGVGIRLEQHDSYVMYHLPQNVHDGEFSLMATNVDEGNVCDKCKVISMGEGAHVDVTPNDYRMTLEVRGADYLPVPGTISYRIITGVPDNHADTQRQELSWTRSEWYFFKMWWNTTTLHRGGYEIRRGGPNGPIIAADSVGTDGRLYRPNPWIIYVGSPAARGGPGNATHVGMTARDVWVSAKARPDFGFPAGTGTLSVLSSLAPPGR
jgi:hypothetical protein